MVKENDSPIYRDIFFCNDFEMEAAVITASKKQHILAGITNWAIRSLNQLISSKLSLCQKKLLIKQAAATHYVLSAPVFLWAMWYIISHFKVRRMWPGLNSLNYNLVRNGANQD